MVRQKSRRLFEQEWRGNLRDVRKGWKLNRTVSEKRARNAPEAVHHVCCHIEWQEKWEEFYR